MKRLLKLLLNLGLSRNKNRSRIEAGELNYINGPDNLPAPLSRKEEDDALRRIEQGDETVRETLIVHNLRLVVYIAKKFENSGVGIEDLISIGTIGLIKAVNTFLPSKNIKLATYASRCVENEILMFLRKTGNSRTDVSLDEPLNVDWDGNELLLGDVLTASAADVGSGIEYEDEINQLFESVSHLSSREQRIISLRFGLGGGREYTQKEVADMLGISQSYISRLEKKIIEQLKRDIEKAI